MPTAASKKRRKKSPPLAAQSNKAQRKPAKALAANPFVALLATVKPDVDARLAGFLDSKIDEVKRQAPQVSEVLHELVQLCRRGGKRTRPALVVTGLLAAAETNDWEAALDAGVALELLHAYFLIHDDWMDRDELRRGAPTVHTTLSQHFRSTHLGAAAAILAGDYAAGLATEALCRVDAPPAVLSQLMLCFAQMQQAAVLGQELDVLATAGSIETTYQLKTSSYSVRGPLLMGAYLAGASDELCGALERVALPTGVAFQLRVDLLIVFGDSQTTGKSVGSDIQEGKRTLLSELALKRLSKVQRKQFLAVYGNPKASAKQIAQATSLLDQCGARALTEQRIDRLLAQALRAIDSSPFRRRGKELLRGAVNALVRREH
ncbi:MAG TPA: polyprenyl synthetase family protein [Polyangiaceae bacterium]|nr:polyprenyl synthetase family protein [Polyangiaceae bacterium]